MSLASLNKKSTANDVVTAVRNAGALPAFASRGGTAVVTGGNSGIGLESVQALLDAGCRVVLCSRDVSAGTQAAASLRGASRVRVQRLDLADLQSVREAADEIASIESGGISLLLNNAGIMAIPTQSVTKQGIELQFGTNHIGHQALTRLLLPLLEDDGRVVTVASTAHTMGTVDVDDLGFLTRKYSAWGAYGQSKAANILFAKGLADELSRAGSGVLSISLHPGVIRTPLWRHGNRLLTWVLHRFILDKDIPQGAATSVFACLAPRHLLPAGSYLSDCAVATPNAACADEDGSARLALWAASERLIAEAGVALPEALVGKPRGARAVGAAAAPAKAELLKA